MATLTGAVGWPKPPQTAQPIATIIVAIVVTAHLVVGLSVALTIPVALAVVAPVVPAPAVVVVAVVVREHDRTLRRHHRSRIQRDDHAGRNAVETCIAQRVAQLRGRRRRRDRRDSRERLRTERGGHRAEHRRCDRRFVIRETGERPREGISLQRNLCEAGRDDSGRRERG